MTYKEKIKEIIEATPSGTVTSKTATEAGLGRNVLRSLVEDGTLSRFSRGLYVSSEAWEDDFYLLQRRYARGIYSRNTALYLLGYSDRAPLRYDMTFPQGYNSPSIKSERVNITRVLPKNYDLGVIELKSPCGNPVRVYDLERTLCDVLRGNGCDVQIVNSAMKKYARSNGKDVRKLARYAEQLHVKPKVFRYLEVLL
ncbi:MAG: type IV toxin-antitoxin system AbiEi family antitoxin domain-containing protein [Thermoguttaceae bacterium]|nr:type IV toxin-antitoxin system AbiEi family antitoxin domain-containing protein [Thermoguttaceae bacterium]MBR4751511.1 type IV toxin-antitoxin system AbiEi family antitoxin domain-containing protein [Thermoguttaceae bacterium]